MSMNDREVSAFIRDGRAVIGIELGSTRIKAVLIGEDHAVLASGNHDWENSLVDSIWTYSLEDVWAGLRASYQHLAEDVARRYGVELTVAAAIGLSGMMHGYLVFDKNDLLLTPFRTWRNNITGEAAAALTRLFDYPIPQRWSIAHLYQAILNNEPHVPDIATLTTLAGYLHWQLTGRKIVGIGEASGDFPVDVSTGGFDAARIALFDEQIRGRGYPWHLADILPQVLPAGAEAGRLTAEGARLLDPTGRLQPGILFCPPEGDAGTGMVATNSIAARTGNVSAGTSVFAMVVLEKELKRAHEEIDLIMTPDGKYVAMVHSNNCTSDYDAWLGLFAEATRAVGADVSKAVLYDRLLGLALQGDPDAGGLLPYGYLSGEHITGFSEGRPLFVRTAGSRFTLANFMRAHLFTALGALKTGWRILLEDEGVRVDEIRGHGGFFKTREVGQRVMAAALGTPVSVMETAGEGGAWGIAVLAAYTARRAASQSLVDYLNNQVFGGQRSVLVRPDPLDVEGYNRFFELYTRGLAVEQTAVELL